MVPCSRGTTSVGMAPDARPFSVASHDRAFAAAAAAGRQLGHVEGRVRAHQVGQDVAVGLQVRRLKQLDGVRFVERFGRRGG